jgi:histidinol-phosphatase (PHP family)
VGFETESYKGAIQYSRRLINEFNPEFIVGSLHHVNDISIDFNEDEYLKASVNCGGIDNLYKRYFDLQYEMIDRLKPRVVGHFDLIRKFDPDYVLRLSRPGIWEKICRNLELIRKHKLILDFNLRALDKGAFEPYVSRPILLKARELEIEVVPGDDSHGVKAIGAHIEKGITILKELGFNTEWPVPC